MNFQDRTIRTMAKKNIKRIIGIIAILWLVLLMIKPVFRSYANTDTIANKIGCVIFEFNTINVEVQNDIKLADIKIKANNTTVFRKGKQRNRVGQEYGHTILGIYHKNQLIAEVGHFKTNNWFTNGYSFIISKNDNNIIVTHDITGPNSGYDNFQKRYVYNKEVLARIDYLTQGGTIYNTNIEDSIANNALLNQEGN